MRHLTKVLLGVLLVVTVACSSPPIRSGGGVHYANPVHRQLGDRKPHGWQGGHPYAHQVHGIDISRWQGDIDWRSVRRAGIAFAFLKATEGGDHSDPEFATYWRQAGAAGIPRGAYHYFYFCRTGAEQARWFIRNVPRERGALPPVLDIEWTHSRTCPRRPDAAEVKREANVFLDIVGRHYGQRPIVYTTVDFYRDNRLGDLRAEFWLRSVADHPRVTYRGQRWSFWQYTGTGTVPGIRGDVDLNAFAGSGADWNRWLSARQIR